MTNEGKNVNSGTTSDSDEELLERLREALEDAASGKTISHEEVWSSTARRRAALRSLDEQMKNQRN